MAACNEKRKKLKLIMHWEQLEERKGLQALACHYNILALRQRLNYGR